MARWVRQVNAVNAEQLDISVNRVNRELKDQPENAAQLVPLVQPDKDFLFLLLQIRH
jgi:hypothetical protein